MLNDLRLAARMLRRSPGFTAIAVTTMALGIAAATTIFSVVYGVLYRPLPFRDPDRIVLVEAWSDQYNGRQIRTSYWMGELPYWRDRSRVFDVVSFTHFESMSVATDAGSESILAEVVTPGFFDVFRGGLAMGRFLSAEDDDAPAAVITSRVWRHLVQGAPDAVGRRIRLNSREYVVAGVVDESFRAYDSRIDLWLTAGFAQKVNAALNTPQASGFEPVIRLHPDVSLAQAQAEVDALSRALAHDNPDRFARVRATLIPLQARAIGDARPAMLVLFAAVGLVLVVATANIANLLLARASSRQREMAIRQSLGASRSQLARFALAESAVIGAVGSASGALLAVWLTGAVVALEPKGLPRLDAIRVDTPVLLFALLMTVLTVLLVGLVPALQTHHAADVLRASATTSSPRRTARVRGVLVVAELAVSVVLLVCASLLGRSFVRLISTEIGMQTDHLVQSLVVLSLGRTLSPDARIALIDRVADRVGSLPGVIAAGVSASLPPNRPRSRVSWTAVDRITGLPTSYLVDSIATTPGFFRAVRLPLLRGRWFTAADGVNAPPVMIISTATARRFFGDQDPIGRTLPIGLNPRADGTRPDITVIGLVGDVRYSGMEVPPDGAIYRPFAQYPTPSVFVVARTSGTPSAMMPTLRRELAAIDPGLVIYGLGTGDDLVGDAVAQPRFRVAVLACLAGLALTLAAVGLYGVVAYSVSQRTVEIGIRMAIGARESDVLTLVLAQGMRLAAIGIGVGLAIALAIVRTLSALLYGIEPTDAWSFGGAAAVLLAVTLAASYVPARRATRVDPLAALRAD